MMMRRRIWKGMVLGILAAGVATQAAAITISAGDYRFVVSTGYTQLVDPGSPAVTGEAFQGNQWAIAQINEMQKKNAGTGLYDSIWFAGSTVPNPPAGTNDRYLTAILGGVTVQQDPANPYTAVNTSLGYNTRSHPVAPVPPQGTGLAHPNDYVDPNVGTRPTPHNTYFIDDTANGMTSYLKLYSTDNNLFNTDVAAGIGAGGGAFGSFAVNTIAAGTLVLDTFLDANALYAGDSSRDSLASNGTLGQIRSVANSDIETGVLAFFQTTGAGAWDALFDSNDPNFFGADGQIDFTATAMIGSPYLPGNATGTAAQYGWDFRDVGQALTINPSTVPEPGTMLLLGSGLLGLASVGRRRRKK